MLQNVILGLSQKEETGIIYTDIPLNSVKEPRFLQINIQNIIDVNYEDGVYSIADKTGTYKIVENSIKAVYITTAENKKTSIYDVI